MTYTYEAITACPARLVQTPHDWVRNVYGVEVCAACGEVR